MDISIDRPRLTQRGRSFSHARSSVLAVAAEEFCSGFADGTLSFFDAVLPLCERFIDFGAYVGFTSLYAATFGTEVFCFEPNPENFALLQANLAANPELAGRISPFRHGVGARDQRRTLYAKTAAEAEGSILEDVERGPSVRAASVAAIGLRDAASVLREVGVDDRTLVKIDIEGAEYEVLPAIAPLLEEHRPYLHVSFHSANLLHGDDPYRTDLLRLRASLQAAEALACYPYMHLYDAGAWITVGTRDRMDFLRQYFLKPKSAPRAVTGQYGFVDSVAFSEFELAFDLV